MNFDTSQNSSFSRVLPGMQLAVDSTSLGAAKNCPRFYFYSIICGMVPRQTSVHLTFGLLVHKADEIYWHSRAAGASHDDALDATLAWALGETWNKVLNRPWISDSPEKNRLTLVRTIVWYFDQFGLADRIQTTILANGKPAVELSFRFNAEIQTTSGEDILFCGHLDRLGMLNGEPVIPDKKTTKHTLNPWYFAQYTPHGQMSMYALAGRVAFSVPVKKIIIDALQVGATFTRFQRGLVHRDDGMLEEFWQDAKHWIGQMELWARSVHWPMNDSSCDKFGGCQYRAVCSRSPKGDGREKWLKADYMKRVWDPLRVRGDI